MLQYCRESILGMGHPLLIINKYIYDNIIKRAIDAGMKREDFSDQEDLLNIANIINMYSGGDPLSFESKKSLALDYDRSGGANSIRIELDGSEVYPDPRVYLEIRPTVIKRCIQWCIPKNCATTKPSWSKRINLIISSYKMYRNILLSEERLLTTRDIGCYLRTGRCSRDYCLHH